MPDPTAIAGATRPVLWNITPAMVVWLYASSAIGLGVFAWGIARRVRVWRIGLPERRTDQWRRRVRRLGLDALAQRKVLRELGGGLPHALLFFGFLALIVATTVLMVHQDFGLHIMIGRYYLWFQSLAANVLGLFALLALLAAAARRYLLRPQGLERREPQDGLLLAALFLLLATGFAVSGLRIVLSGDPWAAWRPVARATGQALAAVLPASSLAGMHRVLWLTHVTLWVGVLAAWPFTKLGHAVFAPLALYFGSLERAPELPRIDFEADKPALGAKDPFDLTWKQLLDLDACTECGRCERACPARTAGFAISPKRMVLALRDHVRANAASLLAAHALWRTDPARFQQLRAEMPVLAGVVIAGDAIWACTTCRGCEAACPVGIEHMRLMVQLRQNLAMEQAAMPDGIAQLPRQLELREHPFCGVPIDRHAWFAPALTGGGREVAP